MEKFILTSTLNQIKFSSGTFKKSTIPNTFLVLKTNKLVRLKN
ncbi:MAG: hypothetical protein ACPHEO_01595 [Flavobacteriaceae bacterium]